MPWEKSSADLIHLFEQIVPAGPNIVLKKMFGYLCAFVNGNLFTGLFRQSMIFRLSPADRAAFLDQPGTVEFEPMPGHKMKSYVLVHDPFAADEETLGDWAKCALQFASALPAKKKAARKKETK
jgi:TfoX/Sxy family transcriptional regulator of competence genes